MKLQWDIYFYNLWSAVMKSVGAQGLSWGGINGLNASGIDVPPLNLKTLGFMLLIGAVLPAMFKFWEQTPLPGFVTEETTTTTRTTVKPPETIVDENKPVTPGNPPRIG